MIGAARLTLCLSVHQVQVLGVRNPAHAGRIKHFPLGVVDDFLNPAPERPPLAGTVGYVGNLTDRVDWAFVAAVAQRLPDVTFHFVGSLETKPDAAGSKNWQDLRARALGLGNVVYEGAVPQGEVRHHYWRHAVNWMPYSMTHPFNVASCPTKIMDALASGRPFLSTSIPEVRLYPTRIRTVTAADEAASNSCRAPRRQAAARRPRADCVCCGVHLAAQSPPVPRACRGG